MPLLEHHQQLNEIKNTHTATLQCEYKKWFYIQLQLKTLNTHTYWVICNTLNSTYSSVRKITANLCKKKIRSLLTLLCGILHIGIHTQTNTK